MLTLSPTHTSSDGEPGKRIGEGRRETEKVKSWEISFETQYANSIMSFTVTVDPFYKPYLTRKPNQLIFISGMKFQQNS